MALPARDPLQPALALLEFDSIAVGIEAGDAMAKRAPIDVLRSGTIHPGRYLVLVGGSVGDVEEAFGAGSEVGGPCLLDTVFLPNVHPQVVAALRGARQVGGGEALGIIETETVASVICAADAGVKGANVRLLDLRLGDGLGGKGYLLFDGVVSEVEAAVAIACERVTDVAAGALPGTRAPVWRVIAQLHREMRHELEADPRFRARITAGGASGPAGEA
jgi:bacterial microcompartment shell protein